MAGKRPSIGPEALTEIPGVGAKIERMLNSVGIRTVRGLKGRDPERLFKKYESVTGRKEDRCILYVFRAAVYYASHSTHDPELLKWWNWKDA